MDVSFSGKPSDHIFEQEPGRPLEAFTGPFAEHVFGKSPEQLAMEEEEKSDETQADGQSSGVSNGVRIKRGFPSQWEKIAAGGPEYIRDEVSAATLCLGCVVETLTGVAAVQQLLFSLEFQTLRRMPRSRWILFTVRRYVDPVRNLEQWPGAAAALAAAVRRKYKGTLARNGLGERENAERILGYLDRIAVDAGIAPGLAGVVPEPWERAALVDGTSASDKDRELRTKSAL